MKIKLTKQEKNWILYDVGNSAFTLLAATILPIYFNYIAGKQGLSDVQYLAYWGYAVSIATLLTALAGPVFGTVADTKGYKKPVFTIALGIGAIASVALGFAKYWLAFLVSRKWSRIWILSCNVWMSWKTGWMKSLPRAMRGDISEAVYRL